MTPTNQLVLAKPQPTIEIVSPRTNVETLTGAICERIELHKNNGQRAASLVLETLENVVRIGWHLLDLKSEFRKLSGGYESYVDRNLPVSLRQAQRYTQVARQFKRDAEYLEFSSRLRQSAGLSDTLTYDQPASPLKEQIIAANAHSFSEMLRVAGVAKPKPLASATNQVQAKPMFLRLGKSLSMAVVRVNRINRESPIESWGRMERDAIIQDLEPLVKLRDRLVALENR
jgi:hypothetical protein